MTGATKLVRRVGTGVRAGVRAGLRAGLRLLRGQGGDAWASAPPHRALVVIDCPTPPTDAVLRALERRWASHGAWAFLFSASPVATSLQVIVSTAALSLADKVAVCRAFVDTRGCRRVYVASPDADRPPTRVALRTLAKREPRRLHVPELVANVPAATAGTAASEAKASLAIYIATPPKEAPPAPVAPFAWLSPGASGGDGPLISVVMTTHNEASLVGQALRSLCAQSYFNLEIIVVDDASTDETVRVVRELAAEDPRIQVEALPRNMGLFYARNVGVRRATGTFLTFQDADDVSRLDRIERCLHGIGDADYAYGRYVRVTPAGAIAGRAADGAIHREGIITLFLRRERVLAAAGYFDPVTVAADSEYMERLRLPVLGLRGRSLPHVLYYARLRAGSLTTAGAFSLFSLDGAKHENPRLSAYIASYRAFHATAAAGELHQAAAGLSRRYASPAGCLAGEQRQHLTATLPWLADRQDPLIDAHAVSILVRNRRLAGGESLCQVMATTPRDREVVVVTATKRAGHIDQVLANFSRQTYANRRLVIVDNSPSDAADAFKARAAAMGVPAEVVRVDASLGLGACLNHAISRFVPQGAAVAKFDDDDHYGPEYLTEQLAVLAARGGVVGKWPLFFYSTARRTLYLRPPLAEALAPVRHVSGATLVFERAAWEAVPFHPALRSGIDSNFLRRARAKGLVAFASSIFNFCAVRRDPGSHTWTIPEARLFSPKMARIVARDVDEAALPEAVSMRSHAP